MVRKVSLKTLRKRAWDACSQYVRHFYADAHGNCICYTCGTTGRITEMQAAHAIGGRNNAVLFDLEIIRVCCQRCNIWLGGNYPVFTLKLIKENSADWFERKLNDSRQTIKFYRADYEQIAADFTAKLKQLSVDKKRKA